jgi:hypothetical protein
MTAAATAAARDQCMAQRYTASATLGTLYEKLHAELYALHIPKSWRVTLASHSFLTCQRKLQQPVVC